MPPSYPMPLDPIAQFIKSQAFWEENCKFLVSVDLGGGHKANVILCAQTEGQRDSQIRHLRLQEKTGRQKMYVFLPKHSKHKRTFFSKSHSM